MLVTGATGYIGQAVVKAISEKYRVLAVSRQEQPIKLNNNVEYIRITGSFDEVEWEPILNNVDIIIHLAARVHVINETSREPLQEFRRVNVKGTEHLVRSAAIAGVKRFIFMSSIAVVAEQSTVPINEESMAKPETPYGISKWEAEKLVQQISDENAMEWVILRPPMVYGAKAPGNFMRLSNIIRKGTPNPLGAIYNKRSFIFIENLVDAIVLCTQHSKAAGSIYHVSDDEALSTTEFIRQIAKAMNVNLLLIPIPQSLLIFMAGILGKKNLIRKLTESLIIDNSKIKSELGWKPPYTIYKALKNSV
ncbi:MULTISPECIES: NAD-dependent epimerase/dehydratase family protein [Paenibacillus]|nr:NAD-dependent epimerase/dehydratase family protein [Paenibacillus naphthalenovorans]